MDSRKEFESFLASVPLSEYRKKYSHVKIVEMNLPKKIQVLDLLYKIYWEERKFISFDEFYEKYLKQKKDIIEGFRIKITMCENCFYRGLKARIYRTWASIITQIQGGYVAKSVFGENAIKMSEELDHKGADIRVKYKGHVLNFQVKKETLSGVVGRKVAPKDRLDGEFIDLFYNVPSSEVFKNNGKKLNGEFRLPFLRFQKDKTLKRLENGFVIFTEISFLAKKKEIDSKS